MSKSTIRIASYTAATTIVAAVLFSILTAAVGYAAAVEAVKTVAGLVQKASPVLTAIVAVWGAAKWLEAQREALRLQQKIPVVLPAGKKFLKLCEAPRELFTAAQRANWVGTCIAPYAGTDSGRKRFADLPALPAAQQIIFPRIVAGEVNLFVLEVTEKELGFFQGGVADVAAAAAGIDTEYPALVAAYETSLLPPVPPATAC